VGGHDGEEKVLGVRGMVAVGFFWVSGGLYGNEGLIASAPPLILLLAIVGTTLLFAIPSALISAELATAIPEDGGGIVWVERAFGWTFGLHNGWWTYVAWVFDCSIYPALASFYAGVSGEGYRGLIALGIIWVVIAIKLCGLHYMERLSEWMGMASLIPCTVWVLVGLKNIDFHLMLKTEGETDWVTLFSWVIWLNIGYVGLGALANEVDNPARTFPKAAAILLGISTLVNLLPVMVSLGQDSNRDNYVPGYFADLAAEELNGEWMKYCMKAGAFLSMIGLFAAQSVQAEVTMAFLIPRLFPKFDASRPNSWFWANREGVAPYQMIANGVVISGLIWLPYKILIECSTLLAIITVLIIGLAFLELRRKKPSMERPFRMPVGYWGAVAGTTPLMLMGVGLALLDVFLWQGDQWDGWRIRVPVAGLTFAVGGLMHVVLLRNVCINPGEGYSMLEDDDIELMNKEEDNDDDLMGHNESLYEDENAADHDLPSTMAVGPGLWATADAHA